MARYTSTTSAYQRPQRPRIGAALGPPRSVARCPASRWLPPPTAPHTAPGRREGAIPQHRLRARVVPVGTLDAPTIDAMWATFEAYYDDVDRARFDADLARKDDVILLTAGGQVVGFTTLTVYRGSVDGQDYAALFSGDTVVDRAYWGGTALQRTFAWYAFRFWLRHRHIRAYWYLISKGYKTYLLLVRNWARAWPKHDRPTPPYEQAVLADLGARLFGEAFDAERGVVVFDPPAGRLKDGVAPPDRALSDPDVQHFLQRNPGYVHGEELCCLGRFEAAAFAKFTSRHLFPMLRRRRT